MPNRLLVLLCIHPLMLSEPAADNDAPVMDVDTLPDGSSDAVAGEDEKHTYSHEVLLHKNN